jgi:hypothetical protein
LLKLTLAILVMFTEIFIREFDKMWSRKCFCFLMLLLSIYVCCDVEPNMLIILIISVYKYDYRNKTFRLWTIICSPISISSVNITGFMWSKYLFTGKFQYNSERNMGRYGHFQYLLQHSVPFLNKSKHWNHSKSNKLSLFLCWNRLNSSARIQL